MVKKTKVFIDASVLIAAILKESGASRFILELGRQKLIKIVLTDKIVQEASFNLKKKYGEKELFELLKQLVLLKENILVFDDIVVSRESFVIEAKDRHVLAGALHSKVNFLVTLDKKHFFGEKIKKASLPVKIILPGDFLKWFRQKYS